MAEKYAVSCHIPAEMGATVLCDPAYGKEGSVYFDFPAGKLILTGAGGSHFATVYLPHFIPSIENGRYDEIVP